MLRLPPTDRRLGGFRPQDLDAIEREFLPIADLVPVSA